MSFDWKGMLGNVAPALASAFGTPAAGLAVKALSNMLLGKPDGTEDEVATALSKATPEQIAAIKASDQQFQKDMLQAGFTFIQQGDEQRTERLKIDMASDSSLSKNIRPGSLAYLLIVVTVLALFDGNIVIGSYHFDIKPSYITLFTDLLKLAFAFYFGSRGIEKVAQMVSGVMKK